MTREKKASITLELMMIGLTYKLNGNEMLSENEADSTRNAIDALDVAIAALREPVLDENGLSQCGCGGNARIKHDGSYSSKCVAENADGTVRYESATVVYPGHTHAWVECDNNKCRCSVGYSGGLIFRTDEEARDAWNTAMGWRKDNG